MTPLWIGLGAIAVVAVAAIVMLTQSRTGGSPSAPAVGAAASPSPAVGAAASQSPVAGASAVPATDCPTSQPPPLPAGETRTVTIATSLGEIELALEADLSPIAVGNFVALASCGYYDGVVFHRTAALPDGTPFVIQGGDPTGSGSGGPGYTIQDEPVTATYARGTVAMARTSQPNSVGSQFFIVLDDGARPALEGANTYQILGTVSAGMDVADAIFAASGGQELPTSPVAMTTVTVTSP